MNLVSLCSSPPIDPAGTSPSELEHMNMRPSRTAMESVPSSGQYVLSPCSRSAGRDSEEAVDGGGGAGYGCNGVGRCAVAAEEDLVVVMALFPFHHSAALENATSSRQKPQLAELKGRAFGRSPSRDLCLPLALCKGRDLFEVACPFGRFESER